MSKNEGRATVDLVVTRQIAAPVEAVWEAWRSSDLVRQWWGPIGFTAPVAKLDFREGGSSLVCMRSAEGHEIYNTWTYRVIKPMERIEFDSRFADPNGEPVEPSNMGLPPDIPNVVPHVVTFEPAGDGHTTLTVIEHGYVPGPVLEMSRQGQEQCIDKLATAVTGTHS